MGEWALFIFKVTKYKSVFFASVFAMSVHDGEQEVREKLKKDGWQHIKKVELVRSHWCEDEENFDVMLHMGKGGILHMGTSG